MLRDTTLRESCWLCFATLLLCLPVTVRGNGFVDDFADNNPLDCEPVCWLMPDCCPADFEAPAGLSLLDTTAYSASFVTQDDFAGDVSVRTAFSFGGPRSEFSESDRFSKAPQFFNTLFAADVGFSFYLGGLYSDGQLFLNKWKEGQVTDDLTADLPFDPTEFELEVELGATETQVELRVWRPGCEERPEVAQVVLEDAEYRFGNVSFNYEDETDRLPGTVTRVEVTGDLVRLFRRGECNDDGEVDISDAVCILNWRFSGTETPGCVAATNVNGDEAVDLSDAVWLLNYLFVAGFAPPVAPYPDCGSGWLVADSELGCLTAPKVCQP